MDFNRKKEILLNEVNKISDWLSDNRNRIEGLDKEMERLKKERVKTLQHGEDLTFQLEIAENALAETIIKGE